jgi:hypothetical protein
VILLSESLGLIYGLKPRLGICVSVLGCELVPFSGLADIFLDVYSDLVVVSHSELAGRQAGLGRFLSILVGQLLVLGKCVIEPKQEPSTHTQGGLWLALARCEAIVVERVGGFEVAAQLGQLVCLTHLELSLGETEVGCLLDILTSHAEVTGEHKFRYGYIRELSGDQHAVDIGSLRGIFVRGISRLLDHVQALGQVFLVTVLAHEVHHA